MNRTEKITGRIPGFKSRRVFREDAPLNETILHITNGDSAAQLIRRSSLPGEVLPWRDVLQ